MIGAIRRRRRFQVSPSVMKWPSPMMGAGAKRSCGLFRSKLAFRVLKANWIESGLLQRMTLRASTWVETNSNSS